MNRIGRIVVIIAIIIAGRQWVLPWAKKEFGGSKASTTGTSGTAGTASSAGPCARAAEAASEEWGRGLARFVNPPYDLTAWSSFRNDVEARIATAEGICTCSEPPCDTVRGAMTDLRSLVADLDTSIRNGSSPPGDVVQRQESIDNRIADAK